MAENERDILIAQLSDSEKVAERRQAAKRLGELRDPAAIDALVNTYLDENEDESVRRAAEQALRIFRRMQQARDAESAPPPEPPDQTSARLRKPLAISLGALVALNVLMIVIRALSGGPPIGLIAAQPTPVLATSRAALIIEAQNYLSALNDEVAAFRQPLLDFQANVDSLQRLPRCIELTMSQLAPRTLLSEDARTQPDLVSIFEALNTALEKFRALRAKYIELCGQQNFEALRQRLQPEGGAAGLVAQLDALLNGEISAARLALEAARLVTVTPVTPTATAISPAPATLTPISATSEASAPISSTPLAPIGGAPTAAAEAPFGLPAVTAIPFAALPIADINYQGVRLAERTRFRYRLAVDYEVITPQRNVLRGALALRVTAENGATPIGRYEISLRDAPEVSAFRDWLPDPFYRQGNAFYTALNGIFYHIGAGLPPQTLCAAQLLGPANIGALATLNVDALIARIAPPEALTVWREAPPADGKPQYRAEFSAQDAEGVQINLSATLVIALDGSVEQLTIRETRQAPAGYAKPLIRERRLSYTLQAADAALNMAEIAQLLEQPCRAATPGAP
jgi:hypothetical protein